MDISIVIVNYNAAAFLKRAIDSIEHHLKNIPHEICIVDNASTDESSELWPKFPNVRVICNEKNLGFATAVNQGLKVSSGSFILWLNPDTQLLDDGLEEILRYMKDHPEVGIIGPRILNDDGSIQLSCRSFPSYQAGLFNRYSLLTRWFPNNSFSRKYLKSDWDHNAITDVDWVSGACLLQRRELLERPGLLDENFFMYCEDVDYCLRAKQQGWKVQFHPGASVMHQIAASSKQLPNKTILERHKSIWHYYRKHFKRNIAKDLAIGAGIASRCAILLLLNQFNMKNAQNV
jgi:N-acetylglucosaminyl-diphospho-decaprenol L-rhamnosyltransferase